MPHFILNYAPVQSLHVDDHGLDKRSVGRHCEGMRRNGKVPMDSIGHYVRYKGHGHVEHAHDDVWRGYS